MILMQGYNSGILYIWYDSHARVYSGYTIYSMILMHGCNPGTRYIHIYCIVISLCHRGTVFEGAIPQHPYTYYKFQPEIT